MSPYLAPPVLLYRVLVDLVVSGLRVAALILRETPPRSAFVRMRYAPMSDRGATLLGALVALAPGASVIAQDLERHELVLHLLDESTGPTIIAEIRRDFEAPLAALFGRVAP